MIVILVSALTAEVKNDMELKPCPKELPNKMQEYADNLLNPKLNETTRILEELIEILNRHLKE